MGPGSCWFQSHAVWLCVQVDSEEPVFEAVLNWVKHNRKEREPYLPDMLEFVRMPLLTPRYITDVIDAEVSPRASAARCAIVSAQVFITPSLSRPPHVSASHPLQPALSRPC